MSLRPIRENWILGRNLPLPAAFSNGYAEGIADEKQFGEMLCLERRRAERSHKPFLLMLLDLQKVKENGHAGDLARNVWLAICSSSRDSDIRGWYLQEAVLGVIFVEIGSESAVPVTEVIRSRVISALSQHLEREVIDLISISMYLQPDSSANWQRWSKLYRDLREKEMGRRLPRAMKRGLDIIGSTTALALLLPLIGAIALLIKLSSRGPVFFRQSRVGHHGALFTMLKFRTMQEGSDPSVHKEFIKQFIAGKTDASSCAATYKIRDDPRVTSIGRFLRKTSLDELPQFWNVLKGEMALVGPRPPIPYEVECYDLWHRRRVLEVKPGITGLWQVRGRSRTTFDEMVRLDLRYARSWSIWLDLRILFDTPRAILSRDGAY